MKKKNEKYKTKTKIPRIKIEFRLLCNITLTLIIFCYDLFLLNASLGSIHQESKTKIRYAYKQYFFSTFKALKMK